MNANNVTNSNVPTSTVIPLVDPANRSNPVAKAAQDAKKIRCNLGILANVAIELDRMSRKTCDRPINSHLITGTSSNLASPMSSVGDFSDIEDKAKDNDNDNDNDKSYPLTQATETAGQQQAGSDPEVCSDKSYIFDAINPAANEPIGEILSSEGDLEAHKKIRSLNNPYSCKKYGKSFHQQIHLIKHDRIQSEGKSNPCNSCEQIFNDKNTLTLHKRSHTKKRPYVCDKCDKTYVSQSGFIQDSNKHTKKIAYSCDQCGKDFT